jgi:hypothetical protein
MEGNRADDQEGDIEAKRSAARGSAAEFGLVAGSRLR